MRLRVSDVLNTELEAIGRQREKLEEEIHDAAVRNKNSQAEHLSFMYDQLAAQKLVLKRVMRKLRKAKLIL
jgi:hypothetical protein